MSAKNLAECILLAANIRESSFDGILRFADADSFYKKTIKDACDEAEKASASHEGYGEVAYMLLANCWNDALDWANRTLAE